ncbi:RRP12-like protein [Tripterygium wilfordii]|uniref:RRP12-like protein n=1 Tax=Tripterygium wilfordii TaxID=458696 RepID=A0A7J7BX42_TRIWF|nr:RRP12-like protein [Tripterygium wilfordii]KAF5726106.1 RRP12-like protein [Tripterygium wilfordii]
MEGIEAEGVTAMPALSPDDDFCDSILSRFSSSDQEAHQHLCAVVGSMSQTFKDENLPTTPVAYFGAACSSMDRLSSQPDTSPLVIEAHMTIISLVLPRLSSAILRKHWDFTSAIVLRVLRSNSVTAGAAMAGVKCVAQLLIIRDTVNWSDVSQLYGLLLGFATDMNVKVRRQSHLCISEVLQSFQRTSLLGPASEGITNIFEKFLLLAGGSNTDSAEGHQGAQKVLHVLDALKECLPLMTVKYTTSILMRFKSLLELGQPIVSRHITNCLNKICLHPTLEVSAEVLLDLLCSLALSLSTHETSVDSMTFTARLLDVGIRKIYSLNRQICIVKLPVVFNALKDVLASEHEEAIYATTEALKNLINDCVDDSLINQGADQMMMNANTDTRKSGPPIIEKLCVTIESLLDYHYSAVWDMAFRVISTMFDKLGYYSSYLMRGTLKNLADMQNLPDEDFPYRKQLHECVGSALGAMGPETFLSLIPLKLEADNLAEVNVWLFPILKQYIIGANLNFYAETIFGLVGQLRQRSRKLELEGRIMASRSTDALVYSLWSLLPSFCNYPLDTAESFKGMQKALCSALREEPDVRGIICSSLQALVQQNKKILEENTGIVGNEVSAAGQRAMAHYTPEVAASNLNVLKSSARDILSVLSRVLLESTRDDGGCLQSTISEFASVSDKEVISRLFQKTMKRYLEVIQEASKAESSKNYVSMEIDGSSNDRSLLLLRARLFDLAVSLLPGLNAEEIELLFKAINPALQDVEGLVQKKAYKVLSIILKECDVFLSSKLEELLRLMIDVLPMCHFSAKRHRLDCLYFLIVHVSKDNSEQKRRDILSSFLTEIILALKEANKKTRNRAYDVLVQIGHACGDEENGGNKEYLYQFFSMVAGGLAGETPHMISAAMKGLARLAYEFSDLLVTSYKLLPSTFLLLKRKNKEIIKANLGLLKVLVAKSQADGLQMHLRSMVEGLLQWQDVSKNHFKAKVKLLLEMLVRKCGLEAVRAVMPEEHMKLLTNIRKIKERKEKKRSAQSVETKSHLSKATTSRQSKWNHTKIFSDIDDEDLDDSDAEYMDAETVSGRQSKASARLKSKASSLRSKRTRKADMSLPEDMYDHLDGEPLDLLDRHKTRLALRSSENRKRKVESDDELEIDSEGRLIIREGEKQQKKEERSDPHSDARSHLSGTSSRKMQKQKRRKTLESGKAYIGSEYASKKARGDVRRKGKLEPYAYWPLDRKMMSRRPEHRAAARKGMSTVVKMTKKLEGQSVASALSMKSRGK